MFSLALQFQFQLQLLQILHDANTYGAAAQGFWWWIMPPGLLIAITGLAFVFIGNTLDTIINPKLKR